jgi:hypothetical protein
MATDRNPVGRQISRVESCSDATLEIIRTANGIDMLKRVPPVLTHDRPFMTTTDVA